MDRRRFVRLLGHSSLLAALAAERRPLWAQTQHEPSINCAPPAPPGPPQHVTFNTSATVQPRKSAWDLAGPELTRLRAAYAALRKLSVDSPNDPRGWMQQANVHCNYCGGGYDGSQLPDIHGSWLFFAWHRCYLYMHERILGGLIGDPTFRLAYWDWDTYPTHSTVPPPFATPSGAGNSLWDQYRGVSPTNVIPASIVGPANMTTVMGTTKTEAFMGGPSSMGALESSPHGPVHIWTGDDNQPATPPTGCSFPNNPDGPPVDQTPNCQDMGLLATAAQDPVFFSHHCNIDRLWDVWLQTPGSQGNPPDSASDWWNTQFNFYDENQNWVYITIRDVAAQGAEQTNLRYTYQAPPRTAPWAPAVAAVRKRRAAAVPRAAAAPLQPLVVATESQGVPLGTKPQVKSVPLPAEHRNNLRAMAVGAPKRYTLHIEGLTLPANESAIVRVFVNDPKADRRTPQTSANYVGSVSIVAAGPVARHPHPVVRNVTLELRPETVAALARQTQLTVTLVPTLVGGGEPAKSSLTYQKIYLTDD